MAIKIRHKFDMEFIILVTININLSLFVIGNSIVFVLYVSYVEKKNTLEYMFILLSPPLNLRYMLIP